MYIKINYDHEALLCRLFLLARLNTFTERYCTTPGVGVSVCVGVSVRISIGIGVHKR